MTCVGVLGFSSNMVSANEMALKLTPSVKNIQVEEFNINPEIMHAPAMQNMYGEIVAIEDGKVMIKSQDKEFAIAALVNQDTYIIKGENGKLRRPSALKVGEKVSVYYSSVMTRSLPPQAKAYAIILGSQAEKMPIFFEAEQVIASEDGQSVRVLNSTQNIIARIDKNACEDFANIKKGDKMLVWCDVMTMSLPGQTNANKVIVLP